jgi:hypothetical protein
MRASNIDVYCFNIWNWPMYQILMYVDPEAKRRLQQGVWASAETCTSTCIHKVFSVRNPSMEIWKSIKCSLVQHDQKWKKKFELMFKNNLNSCSIFWTWVFQNLSMSKTENTFRKSHVYAYSFTFSHVCQIWKKALNMSQSEKSHVYAYSFTFSHVKQQSRDRAVATSHRHIHTCMHTYIRTRLHAYWALLCFQM